MERHLNLDRLVPQGIHIGKHTIIASHTTISSHRLSRNPETYPFIRLDSILVQLDVTDEIIISDDGSIDSTCLIIKEMNDRRIKLIHNYGQHGYIFNMQNAILESKGEFIFFADQDDVWLPNKIEIMTKSLEYCDLVLSDCYVTDSELNIIYPSYYKLRKTTKNKIWSLLGGCPYIGCCLALKRTILYKALPFPKNINSHDIWIGNIAAFYYKIKIIDDKLIYYRRHNGNTSVVAGTSKTSNLYRFIDRIKTITNLLSRII